MPSTDRRLELKAKDIDGSDRLTAGCVCEWVKSRRFGTLCRFHLQQVVKCESLTLHHLLKMELTQCPETSAFNTQTPEKYPEDNLSKKKRISIVVIKVCLLK